MFTDLKCELQGQCKYYGMLRTVAKEFSFSFPLFLKTKE